ncbi:DUF885 domain-containing protein [Stutzerimonas tarimensis]|uniref:DUF885 domain-containing protein n=1 Tax=Stutzerimonas tarimensis TaxID=1507735 RepID=A0ABV7T4G2_9GAMM
MSPGANPQLHQFFEEAFEARIERSPQTLTTLGIRRRADELDDYSDAARVAEHDLVATQLEELERFDPALLCVEDRLSHEMFRYDAQALLDGFRFRHHGYLVNQKFGLHTDFPAFMINMHRVADVADARAYIARLGAFDRACNQVIIELERREAVGMVPPAYLFPQMIGDCRAFVADGDPQAVEGNPLYRDLADKLDRLGNLPTAERQALLQEAARALSESVLPAYRRLAAFLERQKPRAAGEAGAWALPDGDAWYRFCLARETTTELSADDIHELGLREVMRLQEEILGLRSGLGVDGSLADLFEHARENPDFYYPDSDAGRARYLAEMKATVAAMEPRLPELFNRLPQDELLIKPVEPHREKTAGLAFYQGPSTDGSRPGIFYLNLHDMRQLPTFATEALAYHEALPGHHMQFAIANRLHHLPSFRRYAWYNAYIEGWGLYSELIPREMGLYQDPWSDFGRLVQELKRACRLVVDTGIHARRWTRQQAIDYLYCNTPSSTGQVINEVDRYLVMPGQATTYTVGMAEILRLRRRLREAMGERFDLRRFHDELLRHGALPLTLLERQMNAWAQNG